MPLCPSTVVLDTAWQGTDLSMSHMEITASDGTLTPGNVIRCMHSSKLVNPRQKPRWKCSPACSVCSVFSCVVWALEEFHPEFFCM